MNKYTVAKLEEVTGVPRRCIVQWIRRGDLNAEKDTGNRGRYLLDPVEAVADIRDLRTKRPPRRDIGTTRL